MRPLSCNCRTEDRSEQSTKLAEREGDWGWGETSNDENQKTSKHTETRKQRENRDREYKRLNQKLGDGEKREGKRD